MTPQVQGTLWMAADLMVGGDVGRLMVVEPDRRVRDAGIVT